MQDTKAQENRICMDMAHFRLLYEEADKAFADRLAEKIEEFYQDICGRAGISQGDDVYDIYVCGTAEDFIRFTGKSPEEYQDWMTGNADIARKRLCVMSPRARGDFSKEYEEYLINIMLHETVHIVFDRIQEPEACEIWLAEGIALYYAGQINPAYVSAEACPRIADIAGDESAFADNGGYGYAGIYVWYLLRQYGMEKFLSFYRGEHPVDALLDEGFEYRAVAAYLSLKS